jgi:hypothetical protein
MRESLERHAEVVRGWGRLFERAGIQVEDMEAGDLRGLPPGIRVSGVLVNGIPVMQVITRDLNGEYETRSYPIGAGAVD